MIIFIGSLIGSGRELLSRKLAEHLGYYLYVRDPIEIRAQTNLSAVSDTIRAHNSRRLADEIPRLVKMHKGLVVFSSFHRENPRNIVFETARKVDKVLIVWIESSDEDVYKRKVWRNGKIIPSEILMKLRQKMQNEFQPFSTPTIVFNNTGSVEDARKRFCALISKEISVRKSDK